MLYDLALHAHRGNVGATHGRSYMKDKSRAADQPVYGAVKLCLGAGDEPWPTESGDHVDLLPLNESASLFAQARRYRPAARHAEDVDTSTSHLGFRCVVREGI